MNETQVNILFTAVMCVLLILDIKENRNLERLLKEVKDLFHE